MYFQICLVTKSCHRHTVKSSSCPIGITAKLQQLFKTQMEIWSITNKIKDDNHPDLSLESCTIFIFYFHFVCKMKMHNRYVAV